ncbi:MAG: DUF1080 domain-containing protein [Planctomycetota bacterium]|nr:DUF1080 domain-containing protein [Planctomycetota bacterium]
MFNGRDTAGWDLVCPPVSVEDGCLDLKDAGEVQRRIEAADFEVRGSIIVKDRGIENQGGISLRRPDSKRGSGIRLSFYRDGDVHLYAGGQRLARAGQGRAPAGRWLQFLVRATGDRVSVEIEGAKVLEASVPILEPGFLALYSADKGGARVAFKDIECRPLAPAPPK